MSSTPLFEPEVSAECGGWSPQSVELGKIALYGLATKYGAWFHKMRKVVSAECGAPQSVKVALQRAELGKIALLSFHSKVHCPWALFYKNAILM